MRKLVFVSLVLCTFVPAVFGDLSTLKVYVDAAPNVYGSANYAPWWAAAKADVVAGTFENMSNGTNPLNVGTNNFMLEDEVVYSFGDLGLRLTFIYWLPDETISSLSDKGFQVAMTNIWDGDVLDYYDWYYHSTWLTPTKWEEYEGGVIGTVGVAWWGAYGVNTPAALEADLASWRPAYESYIFKIRMEGGESSMTVNREGIPPVPAPGAVALGMLGLGLIGWVKRRMA